MLYRILYEMTSYHIPGLLITHSVSIKNLHLCIFLCIFTIIKNSIDISMRSLIVGYTVILYKTKHWIAQYWRFEFILFDLIGETNLFGPIFPIIPSHCTSPQSTVMYDNTHTHTQYKVACPEFLTTAPKTFLLYNACFRRLEKTDDLYKPQQ